MTTKDPVSNKRRGFCFSAIENLLNQGDKFFVGKRFRKIKQGFGVAGLMRLFAGLYGENAYNKQRAQRVFEQAQKINLI